MHLKLLDYESALQDFNKALLVNPTKGFAYLGKATCEVELGLLQEAVGTLTAGLNSDCMQTCLEKRGMCYFELKEYERAVQDFERCTESTGETGGSLYHMKGVAYYQLKQPIEAILAFEESLKQDTNQ
jgi:tetratricopeptide (TPR) repeat protein